MITLAEELNKLFLDNPEGEQANWFLKNYGVYSHLLDDIIDNKETDHKKILPSYMIHLNLLSSDFYRKHQHELYPVMRLIHHVWQDSIEMEKSPEDWKRQQAETLKGIGIEMTLSIIEILGGYETRRRLSIMVREHAYTQQHKDNQ
jgi:hypothetical protein